MQNVQSPKVVLINVVVTFVEAFLPQWAISGNQLNKLALMGAASAGISAVWNLVIKPFMKTQGILYNKVS